MKKHGLILVLFAVAMPLRSPAQGPLDPGGPPAPAMKTLNQVEPRTPITNIPYTISSPGSYYITGHLTCRTAAAGIYVATNNVTIDLCGFTLDKFPSGSWPGINTAPSAHGLTIKNGLLSGWSRAIQMEGPNNRVEDIAVTYCGNGIWVGDGGVVSRCKDGAASETYGILTGRGSMVLDSLVQSNLGGSVASYGVKIGSGSMVSRCVASYMVSTYYSAAFYGLNSVFYSDCSAAKSGLGFISGIGSYVLNCTATDCSTGGVVATDYSRIAGCALENNGGSGIAGSSGSQFENCVVVGSANHGITMNQRSSARECTARSCGLCGIRGSHDNMVLRNTCTYNGLLNNYTYGAGVFLQGYGSWAHGNTCVFNLIGLEVAGSSNLATACDCRFNIDLASDFVISAGNGYGQILSFPGDGFLNSNPWANFQF